MSCQADFPAVFPLSCVTSIVSELRGGSPNMRTLAMSTAQAIGQLSAMLPEGGTPVFGASTDAPSAATLSDEQLIEELDSAVVRESAPAPGVVAGPALGWLVQILLQIALRRLAK